MRPVSNLNMRMRWRAILCLWGLALFALLTYGSMEMNREIHGQDRKGRYFWWGSVRLDSDPLNEHPTSKPCAQETQENCSFDPQYIFVTPGFIERALFLSALPALLVAIAVVRGAAHLGVSELLSFMIAMPLFTIAWFYAVGWFLDRWLHRRSLHRATAGR